MCAQSWIKSRIQDTTWIGFNDLYKEGLFLWSDGTEVDYSNWDKGEPNNGKLFGSAEHVVEMLTNGEWNDVADTEKYYICKRIDDPATIYHFPTDTSALRYEEVTFTCMATGTPKAVTYRWYKDDIRLRSDGNKYYIDDGLLRIKYIALSDDDDYLCVADNGVGEDDDAVAHLDVQYPPVAETDGIVAVREGLTTNILCKVTDGNPLPCSDSARWKRPEDTVFNTDNPLQIHNIQRNQAGIYLCEVTNTYYNGDQGQGSSESNVIVEYPPDVYVPDVYSVIVGNDVIVNCMVDAVPNADIKWISFNDRESEGKTLTLQNVQKSHDGIYTCHATNTFTSEPIGPGTGENTTHIDVQYGPEVSVKDRFTVAEGAAVSIECIVDANPAADVVWTKGDIIIQEGNQLNIPGISRHQSGEYVCVGRNTLLDGEEYTDEATTWIDIMWEPEPATDLTVTDTTETTVSISWTAGFDGGASQQFCLVYSELPTSQTQRTRWTAHTEQTITALFIATEYAIEVVSENWIGNATSGSITETTLGNPLSILVVVLLVFIVILVGVILFEALFIFKQRKSTESAKDDTELTKRINRPIEQDGTPIDSSNIYTIDSSNLYMDLVFNNSLASDQDYTDLRPALHRNEEDTGRTENIYVNLEML
uniref:Hemicentin-1-like n=1 Tax=Saccoglossus kowalevskii TaxID=10224 RepID=A0ABM0M883_SACKO|nr:PREDICTED: hemicentin-1-like [Saccoglossus kowalevskii]